MPQVGNEVRSQIEENLNLNKPLLEQYFSWASKAIKGDFSYSLISGEKVSNLFWELIPNTFMLGISAFVLVVLLSIFLGTLSVMYRDSVWDKAITYITMSFFALPNFCLALLFILLFSVNLKLLPSSGISDIGFESDFGNRILHLILPISTIVLTHLAIYVRFIRTCLINSLNESFVEGALVRGISTMRLYFHLILKHAISPALSYFGANAVSFMTSIYIVENVFAYGGVGNLMIRSIIFKDYPVVLMLMVFSLIFVMMSNLIVDLINLAINPRLQYA